MELLDSSTAPLFRFYDSASTCMDEDLAEAVEQEFEYTVGPGYSYEFHMEEEDFYKVLSVVDAHNAPVLIQLGLTTPQEVIRFLGNNHLQHLIRNNTLLTETASSLKIPVGVYIDMYASVFRRSDGYERIMKGMQEYSSLSPKMRYCRTRLIPHLVSGMLSYESVRTIGYSLIEENSSNTNLIAALVLMKDREDRAHKTSYGPEDLKAILIQYKIPAFKSAALKLILLFGAEDTFKIRNLVLINKLVQEHGKENFPASLALFIDSAKTEMDRLGEELVDTPIMMSYSQCVRLHDAGVDPLFAAQHAMKDEWDVKTVIALHEGITQPLTDGFL